MRQFLHILIFVLLIVPTLGTHLGNPKQLLANIHLLKGEVKAFHKLFTFHVDLRREGGKVVFIPPPFEEEPPWDEPVTFTPEFCLSQPDLLVTSDDLELVQTVYRGSQGGCLVAFQGKGGLEPVPILTQNELNDFLIKYQMSLNKDPLSLQIIEKMNELEPALWKMLWKTDVTKLTGHQILLTYFMGNGEKAFIYSSEKPSIHSGDLEEIRKLMKDGPMMVFVTVVGNEGTDINLLMKEGGDVEKRLGGYPG